MREYSNIISLTKNARGIYSLDPSIGCHSGLLNEKNGCYNDCYAAKSAKLYGYDFSKTVFRYFRDEKHRRETIRKINLIGLDFIRMGTSGDPSEDWDHTISIIDKIKNCNKEIVIITRHWTKLKTSHLKYLSDKNICINTSISALDKPEISKACLDEYSRIKQFCKSILRVVSADFNQNNPVGLSMKLYQDFLFSHENVIDTVLRLNKNNALISSGIVNVKKSKFLGKKTLISKANKKTYFGKCSSCKEMCGVNISDGTKYSKINPTIKQTTIFPIN